MLKGLDILSTSPTGKSLCIKERYHGYEISTVLEQGNSGGYHTCDVRIYDRSDKDNVLDMTSAFYGLLYQDDDVDPTCCVIDYNDKIHAMIKKIIDALL